MKEWCLTHYWMFFIIIVLFILAIDNALSNYFKVKSNGLELEELKINIKTGDKNHVDR